MCLQARYLFLTVLLAGASGRSAMADEPIPPAVIDAPLTSVVQHSGNAYATNEHGMFRANLKQKVVQQISLPSDMPKGGYLASVPFDSPLILYFVNEPAKTAAEENKGQLFGSGDGGATWRKLWQGCGLSSALIVSDLIFITLRGDRPKDDKQSDLLYSDDLGKTWHPVPTPQRLESFSSIQPDPEGLIRLISIGSLRSQVLQADDDCFNWSRTMYLGDFDTPLPDRVAVQFIPSLMLQRPWNQKPENAVTLKSLLDWMPLRLIESAGTRSFPVARVEIERNMPIYLPVPVTWSDDSSCGFMESRTPALQSHGVDDIPAPSSGMALLSRPSLREMLCLHVSFPRRRAFRDSDSVELIKSFSSPRRSPHWSQFFRRRIGISRLVTTLLLLDIGSIWPNSMTSRAPAHTESNFGSRAVIHSSSITH